MNEQQSFSDSSLEDGSVLSDLESELSSREEELADSFCWEEVPEDVSDLDNVEDMSVTDAGGGLRCLDAVLGNRGAEVVVICRPTPPPCCASLEDRLPHDLFPPRLDALVDAFVCGGIGEIIGFECCLSDCETGAGR
jgi:hypothetical protein